MLIKILSSSRRMAGLFAICALLGFQTAFGQQRGDIVYFNKVSDYTVDSLTKEITNQINMPGGLLGLEYDIAVYKVKYYTLDWDDVSLTQATGLVVLPTNYPCKMPVATYGHGFCLKHREVPSSPTSIYQLIGKGVASNGFVAVLPDYVHMGEDADVAKRQGFMHANSEAAATIDLIRAARKFCAENSIELNGQVFLSGYSQGGHSSMATAREMQTHFPEEFNVAAAAPGGGSYDLAGICGNSLASEYRKTPEPHAMCMVIRSYITIYKDTMLADFGQTIDNFLDVFKFPYDTALARILDPADAFANTGLLDSIPVRMLKDSLKADFQTNPNSYMRTLLARNSLYNWTPQMPLRMYHSSADIENPFANVQFTLQQFQAKGAPNVSIEIVGEMSHPEAAVPHLLFMKEWFKEYRQTCQTAVDEPRAAQLKIYPNPAAHSAQIDWQGAEQPAQIQLFNSEGRIVYAFAPANEKSHTLRRAADWPAGMYYLMLRYPNRVVAQAVQFE